MANTLSETTDCAKCKAQAKHEAIIANLDPRFRLERAEIRYLTSKGWIMYCGTMTPWADAATPKTLITQDEAVRIQKERDQ